MGSIAGDMVVHNDIAILNGTLCLGVWAGLTFIVEFISLKSTKARVLLDGEPTIIIKKGQMMRDALKTLRLNIDDVTMLLRINNVFSIKDVEYAIYEPNGQLSVFKKAESETYLPSEIISDGKMVKRNLKELGLDEEWVQKQLLALNILLIDEVFYAEIQKDGKLYVVKY
jgi:uncharacterized membrane protein YcaP (DUF421 family)